MGSFVVALVVVLFFWAGFMVKKVTNWEQISKAHYDGRLSGFDDAITIKCRK